MNRSILEEILKEAEAAAAAKEKHVRLSVNVPQAVIQVNFVDQPVGEEILTEEANEGEEGGLKDWMEKRWLQQRKNISYRWIKSTVMR